jgi:hypothetical protein
MKRAAKKSRHEGRRILFTVIWFFFLNVPGMGQPSIPHLQKQGTAMQLIVDGRPYLILGGELHNSSSSNLAYMDNVFQRFAAGNINTALAAVCWDLLEPKEGQFDFKLVDGAIESAKKIKSG